MKIAKHITFYYTEQTKYRINYINKIIHACESYMYTTDLFIHINVQIDILVNLIRYNNGNIYIIYHDISNENPWLLPTKCRSLLKLQKDYYDIFMYIEDDILVPKEALEYWLEYKDKIIPHNYNLGFFRIEVDSQNQQYCTDNATSPNNSITSKLTNKIELDNIEYIINDMNTYCAFWIYDKNEFSRFVNSPLYDINNIKGYPYYNENLKCQHIDYGVCSAIGLHGKYTDWYKATIIPIINYNKLHNSCKIYHLPNNYINKISGWKHNLFENVIELSNKFIIFNPLGRLGNAIFRYMSCVIYIKNNPKLKYILDSDFAKLQLHPYTYYKGLDFGGNDITCDSTKTKQLCDANLDADGYNTLGYIKHNIDVSKLESNNWINQQSGHGLYVKNMKIIDFKSYFKYIENNKTILDKHIFMDGWGFHQYDVIYLENKEFILNYIEQHKNEHIIKTDTNVTFLMKDIVDDIVLDAEKIYENVIHIRLGDFNGRIDFIELEYRTRVFEQVHDIFNNKTAIIIEPPTSELDKQYLLQCLDWFKERNLPIPKVESNNLMTDFNIMKQSKILISSMSTLCWTAAYFSKTLEQCYMPNYNFFGNKERIYQYFKKPIPNTILYDVKTTQFQNLKVILLTLEKYPERMHKIQIVLTTLSQIGLQYEIVYGILGSDIKITDTAEQNIQQLEYKDQIKKYDCTVRANGQKMGLGELGCAWSHLNIYDKLLKDSMVDIKYLILEDDANLVESLDYLYDCLKHLPTEFDMCHIAMVDCYPFIKTNKVNEYWYSVVKQYFNRATAYIISKKGAQKIIDYTNNYINVPADDLLSNMHLQNKLQVIVPETYAFMEKNNVSIIEKISS